MKPLYISFFTTGTPYQEQSVELEKTLREFGLDYYIEARVNLRDWKLNCQQKPKFIQECREKFPDRALVWVDADARIRKYPELFDRLDPHKDHIGFHKIPFEGGDYLGGTIYVGIGWQVDYFLTTWIKCCTDEPDAKFGDQTVLPRVVERVRECAHDLNIVQIPPAYVLIFDLFAHLGPPVIEHLQASRTCANSV